MLVIALSLANSHFVNDCTIEKCTFCSFVQEGQELFPSMLSQYCMMGYQPTGGLCSGKPASICMSRPVLNDL